MIRNEQARKESHSLSHKLLFYAIPYSHPNDLKAALYRVQIVVDSLTRFVYLPLSNLLKLFFYQGLVIISAIIVCRKIF